MKTGAGKILHNLVERLPELEPLSRELGAAHAMLATCFAAGGKLLVCGNGGSAADCEHIVGELMKGFLLRRPLPETELAALRRSLPDNWEDFGASLQRALPTISLAGQPALATAFANDVRPDMVFAQQVYGYGRPGDLLLALSTSGESHNVVNAARAARAFGLAVLGFTGRSGGSLAGLADLCIKAPAEETYRVQEYHQAVYHALCAMLEEEFFGAA